MVLNQCLNIDRTEAINYRAVCIVTGCVGVSLAKPSLMPTSVATWVPVTCVATHQHVLRLIYRVVYPGGLI